MSNVCRGSQGREGTCGAMTEAWLVQSVLDSHTLHSWLRDWASDLVPQLGVGVTELDTMPERQLPQCLAHSEYSAKGTS